MLIKRKFLKHGDIVEVPLPHLGKFSYGKIIDPKLIEEPIDFPLFLRVYISIHDYRIESVDQLNRALLLAPFYLVGQSAAVNKFGWRIVENEIVTKEEEWIPDTKEAWPLFSETPEKWGYKKRFSTKLTFSERDKVQHLDYANGKNVEVVSFIIELELLKKEDKDIQKEFGVQGWLEQTYYKLHSGLPIYTELPATHQGKVVE
jgi:hypothetical protein